MIVLPDVRPKRLRQSHARYGRFLTGVCRGANGLQAAELVPPPLSQIVPEIDYSTSPATVLFASSERYFVIGSCDCSTFIIIDRCSSAQSPSQTKICIPEFVAQILIRNDQVFFRAALTIYIYTTASTSLIEVSALDMCIDRRLYVLCADRILIYDEALSATVCLTRGASRIAAAGDAVFVARGSVLYKIVDGCCVFTHDCVHAVSALATDSGRLYALSTNGTLTSVTLFSHIVCTVETHVEHGTLHLVGSLAVLHNGRNGCLFFTRDTLCLVHSELLDTACTALSCAGSSISYLCQGVILTHLCSRIENLPAACMDGQSKSSINTDRPNQHRHGTSFFEALCAAAPKSVENDLDRELQELIDREEHVEADQSTTPDGSMERLCALLSAYGADGGDEPSTGSSGDSFYFSTEKSDQAVAAYLERVAGCKADSHQKDRSVCVDSKLPDRPDHPTNPPTPLPPARAVPAGPNLVATHFSPHALTYRRSGFFVENHTSWFVTQHNALPDPEIPLGYTVYEYIERITAPQKPDLPGPRKPAAPGNRRTRRNGGF